MIGAYFCLCLTNKAFHQNAPILGHATRVGEAKNPGPQKSTCLINMVLANPTSLANKRDTITQLLHDENINVLCLAETSATEEVQNQCQKDMAKIGYTTFWSTPVAPQRTCHNGAASVRGRAGGTATMTNVPMRRCRNPLPSEWNATTRLVHTIASWGQSHVQIFTLYSIPQSHQHAKEYLNNFLTMVLQQAATVPLPFIICGDFNMELRELPIWEAFQRKGCNDLIALHSQKYGTEMKPTCQGVTRPDNAIISRQLIPFLGHIRVLTNDWFATHSPVFFSLQLPQESLHKITLKMPKSWVEMGIDTPDLQEAYARESHIPHATTLEEWGQKLENLVDSSLRDAYAKTQEGPAHLPRAYRGRCQPRHPVKTPVFSAVRRARQGDFEPQFEVNTMATKRKIKQVRRIQCLLRRVQKLAQGDPQNATFFEECQHEWIVILKSTAFGIPFHQWLSDTPEIGYPQWPVPTASWLHNVNQLVQHVVTQEIAKDHAIFSKKCQFLRTCDQKYKGSSQAFSKVKGSTPAPITEVFLPAEAECVLVWKNNVNQIECFCEDPSIFTDLAPVTVLQAVGWIIQHDSHSFTAQFHEMPNSEETTATVKQAQYIVDPNQIADQLTNFWAPLWQAEHNLTDTDSWPKFEQLLEHLPRFPETFHYDDSLQQWKTSIRKLRSSSARGFDAVSAQEIKMLPDEMIEELISVCNNYTNGFPTWFMRARVCPLNKTEDVPMPHQSRPICILSQIYRLFAGVFCSQVLRFWSCKFPPSITGMLPQRGSHDAAYAVQVMVELASQKGQVLSGLTLDIKKCFNCIRHAAGQKLLLALGLPQQRVSQFMHSIRRIHRYWEINGQCLGPIEATCGFPEGDSHSVLVMLAVALLCASNAGASTSNTFTASAYADNWAWSTEEISDNGYAASATAAVTRECGLSIDWTKTWRWATDTETADLALASIQTAIPNDEVTRSHNAKDLGLQLHYSGVRILGSRKDRLENGLARITRLAQLPHNLTVKELVLRNSIYPAMFYGSELFPVATDVFAKVRTGAAEALLGQSHSMSPALALLLTKGTILDPEFVVMAQAMRTAMMWLSKQSHQRQNDFFHAASSFVGNTMTTKGPASTLKHYLKKLSWSIDKNGFLLIDGVVKCHLLRDGFPTIKNFMSLAWQQQLVLGMTSRFSLFSMPDVSRTDTVAILKNLY